METLRNTFHDTTASTRYTRKQLVDILSRSKWDWTPAEQALVRRLHDKLCGSKDCTCSNAMGERY